MSKDGEYTRCLKKCEWYSNDQKGCAMKEIADSLAYIEANQ